MTMAAGGAIPVRQFDVPTPPFPSSDSADITWERRSTRRRRFASWQEAVDGGVTFFDNCWEYRRGKTELWMGAGLEQRCKSS